MRRFVAFGLGAATLAAAQQSVSVFTVVVPSLSTGNDINNPASKTIDSVSLVHNVTTATVYICPSGSGGSSGSEGSATASSSLFSSSAAEAESPSGVIPSTTVATGTNASASTSQPAALPTAAGEHINFEGSMMGLVVFCALGLLIL